MFEIYLLFRKGNLLLVTSPLARAAFAFAAAASEASLLPRRNECFFRTSRLPDVIARTTQGSSRIAARPAGRRANACTNAWCVKSACKVSTWMTSECMTSSGCRSRTRYVDDIKVTGI